MARTAPAAAARTVLPNGLLPSYAPPLLFAVSGAAALVLEVVWTRWLVLSLGASARATTLVLAVYMAGLGLGAHLGGRLADRRPARTLRYFALAELFIGAWGLVSILLLGQFAPSLAAALARVSGFTALPVPLRALIAALALAPPTLLMGATLPLLARWTVDAGWRAGRGVGALYTLNTLGGALGALAAPFVLIEALGLSGAAVTAALADFAVAGAAWWLGRAGPTKSPAPAVADKARTSPGGADIAPAARVVVAAAALAYFGSGFIGLALEVVVHRVLAVLAGSSVYAFSIMLAAFLFGIALGAAAVARLADRVAAPLAALGVSFGVLALGVGLAQRVLGGAGWAAAGRLASTTPVLRSWSYGFEMFGCLATLLPATLALGAVVPFVARVASLVPDRLGRRFGAAYALNTAGAVLGAAAAGLVLVPVLGSGSTLTALTIAAAITGVLVAAVSGTPPARIAAAAAVVVLSVAGLGLGWGVDPVRAAFERQFRGRTPLAFVEGPVQTIAIFEEDNDQQLSFLRLVTNRTSLTGTHLYARRYMTLLGHLPALWAGEPRRACVICFGTGMTASAVAAHSSIEQLDIAEISPEVVAAAPLFEKANEGVLRDSRVRLHVEDGRHVLLAAAEGWDLITLEPPPPRESGVVSLYTTDFYQLCRRRLRPGGVVAQWIPLHSQSAAEVRMLVRTFLDSFPHVVGFLPVERDLILLGGDAPLVVDPAEFARRMSDPRVQRSLAATGFTTPADLLATAIAGPRVLRDFAGDMPVVTDDRPRVELFARYGKRTSLPDATAFTAAPTPLAELVAGAPGEDFGRGFADARAALFELLRGVWAHEAGRSAEGDQRLLRAVDLRPGDPYILWAAGLSDEHLARLRRRAEAGPADPRAFCRLGGREAQRRRFDAAEAAFRRALAIAPDDPEALWRLGALLMGPLARPADGRAILLRFLEVAPNHPAAAAVRRGLRQDTS